MKRLIASVLLILLIVSLWACGSETDTNQEPLIFYYPWADLEAAMKQDPYCTAIGYEEREISGNRDSLRYVLTLYFRGPMDSDLTSPFPSGTSALDTEMDSTALTITLSSSFAQLRDMDLTLACSCLARTCFGITDAESVIIRTLATETSPEISITIARDNYLLEDLIPDTESTE